MAIDGATSKEYEIRIGTGDAAYTGPGTYTFEVQVEYVAKDKGSRDYVSYTGRAQNVVGDGDLEIVITPKPGKPTITIEAVID